MKRSRPTDAERLEARKAAYPGRDFFLFFSKSRDEEPGKGTGEHVRDPLVYETLRLVSASGFEFRPLLSNFGECCRFEYRGVAYPTVEHAFHATKLLWMYQSRTGSSFEEKTKLLDDLEKLAGGFDAEGTPTYDFPTAREAKALGGKVQNPMTRDEIHAWAEISQETMWDIQTCKLDQCADNPSCGLTALVVLATHDAVLLHSTRAGDPVRFKGLETWRSKNRAKAAQLAGGVLGGGEELVTLYLDGEPYAANLTRAAARIERERHLAVPGVLRLQKFEIR